MKDFELKIELKEDAKITQQRARHLPINLQEAFDKEMKRLIGREIYFSSVECKS